MIPKIIHQVYFGFTGPMDKIPLFVESSTKMKELHPDWEYKLWSEEMCEKLVTDHLPTHLEFYRNMRYNIQRVDFIRYLILFVEGGFYCDLDMVPIQSFEPLRNKGLIIQGIQHIVPTHNEKFMNDFMASESGLMFWKVLLDELVPNYYEKANNPIYDTWKGRFVLQTTGPKFLIRMIKKYVPRLKPTHVVWTKWRNENWKDLPREKYYVECHRAGSWLSDVSNTLKTHKTFVVND